VLTQITARALAAADDGALFIGIAFVMVMGVANATYDHEDIRDLREAVCAVPIAIAFVAALIAFLFGIPPVSIALATGIAATATFVSELCGLQLRKNYIWK
jgi:hypothetical protein